LKSLSLNDGLELVKRFAKKKLNISKLWRHSNRVTHLAAVFFCSTAVSKPFDETKDVLTALVDTWLNLKGQQDNFQELISSIRKVAQITMSSQHMYIFCEGLNKKVYNNNYYSL